MVESPVDPRSERVLIAAPVGRDAAVIAQMLGAAGIQCESCAGLADVAARLEGDVGAALLTDEVLIPAGLMALDEALVRQPAWSDIPLLVLASTGGTPRGGRDPVEHLAAHANVTLLERPVRVRTLVTAVNAALRARRRQYDARELLTREQQARHAAEVANRLKDDFVATVSHELRTPLTAILGWTRMLTTGRVAEDQRARALAVIDRNARTQVKLVEDLLDFSRIVAGKFRLALAAVDVAPLVAQVLESVRPAADAKCVRLAPLASTAERATVMADHDRLQQIVWNLLTNAIKFTPSGGDIRVSVETHGPDVLITVRDSGRGIAADFVPFVFDRFRQADSSATREHGGLGLGLAIVKSLIEQHAGRIEVQSDGEGRGATFRVFLPSTSTPAAARESDVPKTDTLTPALVAPSNLAGLRVLVVDDEADARELLRELLENSGTVVTTASSAHEALAVLSRSTADVLVSDIGMPDKTGYELIREVRALPQDRGGRLPAVALTAYARSEDRARALAAGFDRHVAKPVEPAELVRAVAELAGAVER